jgi:hypothetical protein
MSITSDHIDEPSPLEGEAPYNAADRRQVKDKAKSKKLKERERDDVMDALLQMANGRAWLAWLLHAVCGLHNPTENGAYDSNALHYREGARAVGLALQAEALRVNRKNYLAMLEEHLNP